MSRTKKNVFRTLQSRLESISSIFSEIISRVSKTLYEENSLETLTKNLEQILKNRVQICLEPKKNIHNSLQSFTKDFEQILKNRVQNCL